MACGEGDEVGVAARCAEMPTKCFALLCMTEEGGDPRIKCEDDNVVLSAEITRSEPGNDNLEKKPGNE